MVVLTNLYSGCERISKTDFECCGTNKFLDYMSRLGWVSGFLYTILTISLVLSYFYLQKAFKATFEVEVVAKLSKTVNRLFLILVVCYTLRTIFLFGQGDYYRYVKKKFWRLELEIILWAIFDLMALGPVLMMHQKNFKEDSVNNLSDDSST